MLSMQAFIVHHDRATRFVCGLRVVWKPTRLAYTTFGNKKDFEHDAMFCPRSGIVFAMNRSHLEQCTICCSTAILCSFVTFGVCQAAGEGRKSIWKLYKSVERKRGREIHYVHSASLADEDGIGVLHTTNCRADRHMRVVHHCIA